MIGLYGALVAAPSLHMLVMTLAYSKANKLDHMASIPASTVHQLVYIRVHDVITIIA